MSIQTLKKQGGFTLLELLIVIVIIGILALLIIPNLTSAPKKSRDTKRKTDITTMRKALEEYYVNNNVYPDSSDWQTQLTAGTAPLMKAIPTDPKNTAAFVYTYTPANSNTTYTLRACLENDGDNSSNVVTAVSPCTTKTFELVNGN